MKKCEPVHLERGMIATWSERKQKVGNEKKKVTRRRETQERAAFTETTPGDQVKTNSWRVARRALRSRDTPSSVDTAYTLV